MPLKGKTIFITGASGGLGRPLVKLLKEAGANVTEHDLERDGDLVMNLDKVCSTLAQDVPDILINLAGVNALDWCEDQNLDLLLDVNLRAPMHMTQAILPAMKQRGSGHIVNIGSMTGLIPLPYYSGYVASKAGLKGFTDALRRELWDSGIAFTHISPRAIRTPMNEGAIADFNKRTHIYLDEPEKIAARIFKAIVKKEKDVRIGFPERFFAVMSFLFPGVVDKGLENYRKAGREILKQPKQTHKTKEEIKNDKSMAA
ncbi:MAG: SDR family NAD(P)-dependent oxidoreductase [Rhodospirillales bacterium]|nr:SDR family NAD(P)-dependent oxidoreductase [Rhodospirillales bacterium]MCB9996892.1 SDR family NAD(P)-dependent oxidoreductase [Rhodospirillales bacterium]